MNRGEVYSMTDKEKTFFRMCIRFVVCDLCTVREVIDLVQDSIPESECHSYLSKWEQLGLYRSNWKIDAGVFTGNLGCYPSEYLAIAKEYVDYSLFAKNTGAVMDT